MVDKDQELLKFVKIHWKMMLRPDFPEQYYKETKKDYFSHFLRNRLGIPRDREIAKIVLDCLLRIGYIKSKNHLEDVLQKPFISKNIYDHEIYLQKFEMTQQKDELDLGLIEKQDYEMSKSEEYIEESIEGSTPESDDKIEEKISH